MNEVLRPSSVTDYYWIRAWAPEAVEAPRRSGKWVIEVHADQLDEAWRRVAEALRAGRLATSAKARTARPHPFVDERGLKVICVHTNAEDFGERTRVYGELRRLGFAAGALRYRTDHETLVDAMAWLLDHAEA